MDVKGKRDATGFHSPSLSPSMSLHDIDARTPGSLLLLLYTPTTIVIYSEKTTISRHWHALDNEGCVLL